MQIFYYPVWDRLALNSKSSFPEGPQCSKHHMTCFTYVIANPHTIFDLWLISLIFHNKETPAQRNKFTKARQLEWQGQDLN